MTGRRSPLLQDAGLPSRPALATLYCGGAMAPGPRPLFVLMVLVICASAALYGLFAAPPPGSAVQMRAEEVVRVSGGQAVLVLLEKSGARRLGVPVSRAEAARIESTLRGVN